MIKEMMEKRVCFAARKEDAVIVKAPYRKFTPSFDMLKHYAKNLIGVPYGQPEIANGVKIAATDLVLNLPFSKGGGIGVRIDVSIKRDDPLGVITAQYKYLDLLTVTEKTIEVDIKPMKHDTCRFILLASRTVDNEVFPELAESGGPVTAVNVTFPDTKIPDGTAVTAYQLNLSDSELRDYLNSL